MASSLPNLVPAMLNHAANTTMTTVGRVAAADVSTIATGSGAAKSNLGIHYRARVHSKLYEWRILLEDRLQLEGRVVSRRERFRFENNCASVSSEEELLAAANIKTESSDVVVYGSRARACNDSLSDWDLLLVSRDSSHPLEHRRFTWGGCSFDITRGGLPALVQQLSRRCGDNNNWLLNACMECRTIGRLSERSNVLLRYADALYKKGPQPLTVQELARVHGELTSRWRAISSSRDRAHNSAHHRLVCRVRSDQLAIRMVYIRYLLDCRWTTSINPLLVRCEREHPALFAALTSYSSSQENEQGTKHLAIVLTNLIKEVDSQLKSERSRHAFAS